MIKYELNENSLLINDEQEREKNPKYWSGSL